MAAYLNDSLGGRTLDEAREWIGAQLKLERARYDRFVRDALVLGEAIAGHPEVIEVFIDGSVQALEQPEFSDLGKVRELLRALDDKSALLELLERSIGQQGVMVSIGSENPRLSGFAVVAASLDGGSKPSGQPRHRRPGADGLRTGHPAGGIYRARTIQDSRTLKRPTSSLYQPHHWVERRFAFSISR